MSIQLSKKQTINLSKVSQGLSKVHFGINWGQIKKGGLFRLGSSYESVDLDASLLAVTESGFEADFVYFGNLRAGYINHSGDDLQGDVEDDGLDNEIITVDLDKAPANVNRLFLFVNSFCGTPLEDIPYAGIRIYEGATADSVDNVLATFDIANDREFNGNMGVILGKLERNAQGEFEFTAIGKTVRDTHPSRTRQEILSNLNNL